MLGYSNIVTCLLLSDTPLCPFPAAFAMQALYHVTRLETFQESAQLFTLITLTAFLIDTIGMSLPYAGAGSCDAAGGVSGVCAWS
jgi:hypothetical protein